jgi:hypothetical protein
MKLSPAIEVVCDRRPVMMGNVGQQIDLARPRYMDCLDGAGLGPIGKLQASVDIEDAEGKLEGALDQGLALVIGEDLPLVIGKGLPGAVMSHHLQGEGGCAVLVRRGGFSAKY